MPSTGHAGGSPLQANSSAELAQMLSVVAALCAFLCGLVYFFRRTLDRLDAEQAKRVQHACVAMPHLLTDRLAFYRAMSASEAYNSRSASPERTSDAGGADGVPPSSTPICAAAAADGAAPPHAAMADGSSATMAAQAAHAPSRADSGMLPRRSATLTRSDYLTQLSSSTFFEDVDASEVLSLMSNDLITATHHLLASVNYDYLELQRREVLYSTAGGGGGDSYGWRRGPERTS